MNRLRSWVTLLATSVVTLVSLMAVLGDRKETDWSRPEKWAVSVASISIPFSFLGALVSTLPPEKSHRLEAPIIAIVLGFWCAGLPGIVDPENDLAVTPAFAIANANLFFFSYASLLFSLLLLGSWFQEKRGDEASPTAFQWLLFAAVSITVMSSSVSVFRKADCRGDDETTLCNRTRFAIYLGLATAIVSLGCVVGNKHLSLECQGVTSFLLIVCWGCAVAYVTFGSGPGTTMGSLYFGTWAALFVSLFLTATALKILIEERRITVSYGDPVPAPEKAAPASEPVAADPEAQAEK